LLGNFGDQQIASNGPQPLLLTFGRHETGVSFPSVIDRRRVLYVAFLGVQELDDLAAVCGVPTTPSRGVEEVEASLVR
jgi:hypothetical protein